MNGNEIIKRVKHSPKVRPATQTDADAVRTCVDAAYRCYVERIGKPPGPMLDDYAEVIRRHRVFVAEERGAVVGVVVLMEQGERLLLDNVAVHPSRQGRGIGKALLDFAEREALRLGHRVLRLYTHVTMHENIALYERRGYLETERRVVKGYSRIYMEKDI